MSSEIFQRIDYVLARAVSSLGWIDFECPILFGFEKVLVVYCLPIAPDKENSVYCWIVAQIRQDVCFQKPPVLREMEGTDASIQVGKVDADEITHGVPRARDDEFHSQHYDSVWSHKHDMSYAKVRRAKM